MQIGFCSLCKAIKQFCKESNDWRRLRTVTKNVVKYFDDARIRNHLFTPVFVSSSECQECTCIILQRRYIWIIQTPEDEDEWIHHHFVQVILWFQAAWWFGPVYALHGNMFLVEVGYHDRGHDVSETLGTSTYQYMSYLKSGAVGLPEQYDTFLWKIRQKIKWCAPPPPKK